MFMARIRLKQLAYVTYAVPDLDLIERFLGDFGLARNLRTDEVLYMRGTGSEQYLYVAEKSAKAEYISLAFEVQSRQDLEVASMVPGASPLEKLKGPGGGTRVRLTSPGGQRIDLVHGIAELAPLPVRETFPLNISDRQPRKNRPVRQRAEATPILRLGHCALWVKDGEAELAWFLKHLELVASDYICIPGEPEPKVIGAFLRLDRGVDFVEHHCILINESIHSGCHHASFEVLDLDAVFAAHEHLKAQDWSLDAGIGRHYLGSLIYDYWTDPFGNRIEHYTDSDIVNHEYVPTRFVGGAEETTQWGMAPPPEFFA
ncbi:VOC family protein [Aminobacter aganoensis]